MEQRRHWCWGAVAAAVWMAALGCTAQQPRDTREADTRSISEAEASWVQPWNTRDTERIVARYAQEATALVPHLPAAEGREAIRWMVKELVSDGAFAYTFEAARVEVAKSGDLAYVDGKYTLTATSPATKRPFTEKGTYLRIYRKQLDGTWKVLRDARGGGGAAE